MTSRKQKPIRCSWEALLLKTASSSKKLRNDTILKPIPNEKTNPYRVKQFLSN